MHRNSIDEGSGFFETDDGSLGGPKSGLKDEDALDRVLEPIHLEDVKSACRMYADVIKEDDSEGGAVIMPWNKMLEFLFTAAGLPFC